jgi:hypothetical protein
VTEDEDVLIEAIMRLRLAERDFYADIETDAH